MEETSVRTQFLHDLRTAKGFSSKCIYPLRTKSSTDRKLPPMDNETMIWRESEETS